MEWIDEDLMDEFRRAELCQWCGRPTHFGSDPHHLFGRGMGGGSRLDLRLNHVSLCWFCHRVELPAGRLLRCDLLAVVAAREDVPQDVIQGVIRDCRNAHPAARDRAGVLARIYAGWGLPSPVDGPRGAVRPGLDPGRPCCGEAARVEANEAGWDGGIPL